MTEISWENREWWENWGSGRTGSSGRTGNRAVLEGKDMSPHGCKAENEPVCVDSQRRTLGLTCRSSVGPLERALQQLIVRLTHSLRPPSVSLPNSRLCSADKLLLLILRRDAGRM